MTKSVIAALLLAAAFALPAEAVPAKRVYVKPATQAAVMDADLDACVKLVLDWMNGPSSPAPRLKNPTPDQAIFEAFDMKGPRMAAAAEVKCMEGRGYTLLELTPVEAKALGKLHAMPDRDRWYDAFIAQDLSARIAAARP